jgi:hypothetical protein
MSGQAKTRKGLLSLYGGRTRQSLEEVTSFCACGLMCDWSITGFQVFMMTMGEGANMALER